MDPIKTEEKQIGKDFDEVCKELVELSKRLNVQIVIGNRPTFRPKQYMIRFTMKASLGMVSKCAYECTLENLKTYVSRSRKLAERLSVSNKSV